MSIVLFMSDVLLALTLLGLTALLVLLAGPFLLLFLHARLRRAGQAQEAALLAQPLPADDDLPHVCVQLPVFNEGAIVQRVIHAAAALDWPRDRLHIQVLDDSTDNTGALARTAAAAYPGLNITVMHRTDRSGFKAGALQAGMDALPQAAYFAIFDVDYLPPADYLRRCMRPLLTDPQLAFAQARFDFLNAADNPLTRMQAIMLDAHLGVEQATRSWARQMLPFNGTCGIWRRSAIDAAGGWRGDTLAEDLDLSYRAWIAGWRGMFLLSVAVPGELPASSRAWADQQHRWAKGFGQVSRRLIAVLCATRSKGFLAQFVTFLHLGGWWSTPIAIVTAMTWAGTVALHPPALRWLLPPTVLLVGLAQLAFLLSLHRGNQIIRGGNLGWLALLRLVVRAQAATVLVSVRNLRGYIDAVMARGSAFQRTPKQG